jgi:cell division protein FtsL
MVLGVVVLALVGSALFYVWTRHEVMSWGYRISRATERQSELKHMNRELRLEVASLRSPGRIEAIAHDKLGLDFPKPGQIQPLD